MSWLDDWFEGKAVVVTGASSGIGRETALAFGRAGARVALMARRRDQLEEVRGVIEGEHGGTALVLPCDVTDPDAVRACIGAARDAFGRLDVVVNNAGVLIASSVLELDHADLLAMMRVNVFGALSVMQAAVPVMQAQAGGGVIVNVDSLAGRRGVSPLGGYSATKFALVGLTEALRTELHGSEVHVSLVMPGVIETPMVGAVEGNEEFQAIWPSSLNMPVSWAVWAIFAAARFRLVELSVPPGAATFEKLVSLAPGIADTVVHWMKTAGAWMAGGGTGR
jgi:uncharacterized protein